MKKLLVFFVCALLSTGLFAVITGSAHDFSGYGWSGGEICAPCHTPHNAITPQLVPLWNHTSAAGPWSQYVDTGTGTLDATVNQPAGVSRACLSCHDGSVALDSFGGVVGSVMIGTINANADFGTDLTNDHPISFTYNTALATADGELHDPVTANSGLGGTIQNDMLFSDSLECASCHDVHNTAAVAGTPLLRITNAASALCLTCHDK
jgi:predicted CXXCH cytochrome family protein